MLASMENYSNTVFRTLAHRHGADLTFTEMSHIEAINRNNQDTIIKITPKDGTPVQVQILTSSPRKLDQLLTGFKPYSGFKGFNLNLSCPSKNVIMHGKGAAMIKRADKTRRLVEMIKDHGYPASIKIRLGLNQREKEGKLYLNPLRSVDPDFFIIHTKHARQSSTSKEDYTVIPECIQEARGIPVIANGGIDTPQKARELQEQGVSGVMIGRAALQDPAIFNTIKNHLKINNPPRETPILSELKTEYKKIHERHGADEKYITNFHKTLNNTNPTY